jgi:hypothetical protein
LLNFVDRTYQNTPGYKIYDRLPSRTEVIQKELKSQIDQILAAYTINRTGFISFAILALTFFALTLHTAYTLIFKCAIIPCVRNCRKNLQELRQAEEQLKSKKSK